MPAVGDTWLVGHAGPVGHSERSVQRLQPSSKFDSKVQIYSWVLLGDGFVFVVLAVPHQPSLPRRAVWNAGGATSLLSREPVADAQ